MKKRFRVSIQTKIGVVLILLTTMILSVYGAYQYSRLNSDKTAYLNELSKNTIHRLSKSMISPLWNYNHEQADEIILSEISEKNIFAILVRIREGEIYIGKQRDEKWQLTDAEDNISGDFIVSSEKVEKDNHTLGTIELYVTPKFVRAELRHSIINLCWTILFLDIALLIVLTISLRNMLIRHIHRILRIANEISGGDFSHEITLQKNDEIGDLANAFRNMKETIGQVLKDTDGLIQAIQEGRLDVRGNPETYAGGWRDLVTGINNIIDAFISPFNVTAAYIDRIAKGEIPERITQEYQGDFNEIRHNLNMLTDSVNETAKAAESIAEGNLMIEVRERSEHDRMMKALNQMIRKINEIMNETKGMIQAVGEGKLDIRGNAQSYKGGWQELVIGINQLIGNLSNAVAHAASVSMEMELAKKIQTVLLPKKPEIIGYEIAASMEPSEEVGGDYYDVISVSGYDWIVIGDVSGHGVTAGLIMMMVQTAIHTVLNENPQVHPSHLLSVINKTIYNNIERMDESKHMTIVVLAAGKEGKFSFSGLHEDILIRRAKTGTVEIVESDGMWIGLEPDISGYLSDDILKMEPGDCMVLFTDGITEAFCEEGEMFGNDRLIKVIEKNGEKSASQIRESIIRALEPCETPDDVTLVVMKRV